MNDSKLSELFPIDLDAVPSTSRSEILGLANCLSKRETVIKTLEKAEPEMLLDLPSKRLVNEVLSTCANQLGYKDIHWDNANIAIVLTRALLCGRVNSSNEEDAKSFVDQRLRTYSYFDDKSRPDVRMKLSEMLEIYRAFEVNFPDTIKLVSKIANTEDKSEYHLDKFATEREPSWIETGENTIRFSIAIELFGFANRSAQDIIPIIQILKNHAFHGTPETLSGQTVLEVLRSDMFMRRRKFRDTTNIDAELPRYIDDLPEDCEDLVQ